MKISATVKTLNILIKRQPILLADAIVWLQGDGFDRSPKVLELYKNGFAPKIIISGNNVLIGRTVRGKKIRHDEANISITEMKQWLLRNGVKRKNIITDSASFNSHDQAMHCVELAKKNNWRALIIVGTWPYYQFRVFLTFLKVAQTHNWPGKIINQFFVLNKNDTPSGRKNNVAELQKTEEAKLIIYKNHLASVSKGISYLEKFIHRYSVNFRKARLGDAHFLFKLRNDPEVRKNSFTTENITWFEHQQWFKKALQNNSIYLYIINDLQKKLIGQIRFDVHYNTAEVSISLIKTFRGRGLSSNIIHNATKNFLLAHPEVHSIFAGVKKVNTPSLLSFKRAGYRNFKSKSDSIYLRFSKV